MNRSFGLFVAASMAVTASWLVAPAGAAPIASPSALQNAMPSSVEAVQYRRQYRNRAYRGSGWVGPGITGALIGGAPRGPTATANTATALTEPMSLAMIRATSPLLRTPMAATSHTVCSVSGPMTWPRAPIAASMACATLARKDQKILARLPQVS